MGSSKKTVGRFREVVQVAKKERRDPRFDPLCGEFNDKLFKESYQFVNEVKSKELVELKKQLRTEEDHERREEVKYLIQRMENQLRAEAQNQVKHAHHRASPHLHPSACDQLDSAWEGAACKNSGGEWQVFLPQEAELGTLSSSGGSSKISTIIDRGP